MYAFKVSAVRGSSRVASAALGANPCSTSSGTSSSSSAVVQHTARHVACHAKRASTASLETAEEAAPTKPAAKRAPRKATVKRQEGNGEAGVLPASAASSASSSAASEASAPNKPTAKRAPRKTAAAKKLEGSEGTGAAASAASKASAPKAKRAPRKTAAAAKAVEDGSAAVGVHSALGSGGSKRRSNSTWDEKEAGGGRGGGADYLYELGAASYVNTNVDTAQNIDHIDYLFTGDFLGKKSDIASGELRQYDFRTYNNIVGDYYVAPKFLEAVTMHITKNYLCEMGCIDPKVKVPLILGIWGGKGMGKTFQTELAFKKLQMECVVMSAGELEHEWAGTPGRLIRERYRRASELSKVYGKFSCLLINDIDAGIGHFKFTQMTVNTQIVVATLMALCDNPQCVSVSGSESEMLRSDDKVRRTPIIVTGNDLSRCFAPLIRDGRMAKFYWKPSADDLVSILWQMYKDDGLSTDDMVALLRRYPNQPLDFFGAIRATTYDNQIRNWIVKDVVKGSLTFETEKASMAELGRRLLGKDSLPTFEAVRLDRETLFREGDRLVREQQHVLDWRLSEEYLKTQTGSASIIGLSGG